MGLRLLALIASFSLMLIGFGALGASPASALVTPQVVQSNSGESDQGQEDCENAGRSWIAHEQGNGECRDRDESKDEDNCKKAGGTWSATSDGKRECKNDNKDEDNCKKAGGTWSATSDGKRECKNDNKDEDNCKKAGGTWSATSDGKRECKNDNKDEDNCKKAGGVWGPEGQSSTKKSEEDKGREFKCWMPINFDICKFTPTGTDNDAALHYMPSDDATPPIGTYALDNVIAKYDEGKYKADWNGRKQFAITPLVEDPANTDHNVSEAVGDQAFLARGCKDAPAPEPVPQAPAPAAATVVVPEIDYCPDVAGVQWEGYDCLTGQPAPVAVEAAAAVAPATVPEAATVPAEEPAVATAPEAATIPAAVPAGGGSSAPSLPVWAFVLIIAGTLGMAVSGKRLAGSLLR
jgi:hypothetical protein